MKRANNHETYMRFRSEFPFFIYRNYSFSVTNEGLKAGFVFELAGKYIFKPALKIPARRFYHFEKLTNEQLGNLVFHIGMVELISYWKAACPPLLIVKPHALEQEQIDWWKKLYYHGLGEFFYLNGIETGSESFMEIRSEGNSTLTVDIPLDEKKVLVPVGGGKDSVVTLELLKSEGLEVIPFVLNPREASVRTLEIAGFSPGESIVVNRTLDKQLLELNSRGFLNGHTPFSALLAFTASLAAAACGAGNIALSNESSASQSTVPGTKINHQYSKSLEFEQDFAGYAWKYLHSGLSYFSFLRPLNELQIARLFAGFPQHFFSFRSCNVGSKTGSWCGRCPKCLFTYIILSPFIPQQQMQDIFGKALAEDESLLPVFEELTGKTAVKPFECVGTPDEVQAALAAIRKQREGDELPALLKHFHPAVPEDTFDKLLADFEKNHLLPESFERILKSALPCKNEGFKTFLEEQLKGIRKVLLLGFGREGHSSYRLLRSCFPMMEIGIADRREKPDGLPVDDKTSLYLGESYPEAIAHYPLIIKSPGLRSEIFSGRKAGITSQTDLFLKHFSRQTIGVTGTKGKSTTASLIAHLLRSAGRETVLLGNIGIPAFDLVGQITGDTVVVFELSAHQLEHLHTSPRVAVLLNIFPEHLDHFGGFENYRSAKLNVLKYQQAGDVAICDAGIAVTAGKGELLTFGLEDIDGTDASFKNGSFLLGGRKIPFDPSRFPLRGAHNLKNALAALLAVSTFGVDVEKAIEDLQGFQPLPHRLEFVGEHNGIRFYNDSISTVVESTMAAVETLTDTGILILGGYDRGIEYSGLVRFLQGQKIEYLIFLGQAGDTMLALFRETGESGSKLLRVNNLQEALEIVKTHAKPGCTVLLSPAAASYDQYQNFEHRGDEFRMLVQKLFA